MSNKFQPNWESLHSHRVPSWYENCKLGIFIHWGLYSVPAFAPPSVELGTVSSEEWFANNPYAEWYYNSINIGCGPTYEHHIQTYGKEFSYENFAKLWHAKNWKPDEWASLFKEAGAKYVVLVTKHHDGFCLFPSKYTNFNSVARGPKRNIVGDLTEAVRKEGLKMGLYYSGILDWQFAHDPIFCDDDIRVNGSVTYEYADYAYKQSMELIDTYHPSVFWNDIGWPYAGEEHLKHLLAHYYNTCEDGVVDDRFNNLHHDFITKEYQLGSGSRESKWEMCRGLGLSFGYNAAEGDAHILSVEKLVSLLVSTVANNGNLLINIGPKADGTIPAIQADKLRGLGNWMKINGEAIYDTHISDRLSMVSSGVDVHFTAKENALYVIADNAPCGDFTFTVPNLSGSLQALDPSVNVDYQQSGRDLMITVHNHSVEQCAVVLKAGL